MIKHDQSNNIIADPIAFFCVQVRRSNRFQIWVVRIFLVQVLRFNESQREYIWDVGSASKKGIPQKNIG